MYKMSLWATPYYAAVLKKFTSLCFLLFCLSPYADSRRRFTRRRRLRTTSLLSEPYVSHFHNNHTFISRSSVVLPLRVQSRKSNLFFCVCVFVSRMLTMPLWPGWTWRDALRVCRRRSASSRRSTKRSVDPSVNSVCLQAGRHTYSASMYYVCQ